jgi:hypothetical protein
MMESFALEFRLSAEEASLWRREQELESLKTRLGAVSPNSTEALSLLLSLAASKGDISELLRVREALHTRLKDRPGDKQLSQIVKIADGHWEMVKAKRLIEANILADEQGPGYQLRHDARLRLQLALSSLRPEELQEMGGLKGLFARLNDAHQRELLRWETEMERRSMNIGLSGYINTLNHPGGGFPSISARERLNGLGTSTAADAIDGKDFSATILLDRLDRFTVLTPTALSRQRFIASGINYSREETINRLCNLLETDNWAKIGSPSVKEQYLSERETILKDLREQEGKVSTVAELERLRVAAGLKLNEHLYLFVKEKRSEHMLQLSPRAEEAFRAIEGIRFGDNTIRDHNQIAETVVHTLALSVAAGPASIAEAVVASRLRAALVAKLGRSAMSRAGVAAGVTAIESGVVGYALHGALASGSYALGNNSAFDNFLAEGAKTWGMVLTGRLGDKFFTSAMAKGLVNPLEVSARARALVTKTPEELEKLILGEIIKNKPGLRALNVSGSFLVETLSFALFDISSQIAANPGSFPSIEQWNQTMKDCAKLVLALKASGRAVGPITSKFGSAAESFASQRLPGRRFLPINEPPVEAQSGAVTKASLWPKPIPAGGSITKATKTDKLPLELAKLRPGDPSSFKVVGRENFDHPSPFVSGRHLVVWRTDNGFMVRDGVPSNVEVLVTATDGRYRAVNPWEVYVSINPESWIRVGGKDMFVRSLFHTKVSVLSLDANGRTVHFTDPSAEVTLYRADDGTITLQNGRPSRNGTFVFSNQGDLHPIDTAHLKPGETLRLGVDGSVLRLPSVVYSPASDGLGAKWSLTNDAVNPAWERYPHGMVSRLSGQTVTIRAKDGELQALRKIIGELPSIPPEIKQVVTVPEIGIGSDGRPIKMLLKEDGVLLVREGMSGKEFQQLMTRLDETQSNYLRANYQPVTPREEKTVMRVHDLQNKGLLQPPDAGAPYGRYQGRPLVGRESRVNGVVDYVSGRNGFRPAVVVDIEKDQPLMDAYKQLKERLSGSTDEVSILQKVFDYVREIMPYYENADYVDLALQEYWRGQHNQTLNSGDKVGLGVYLKVPNASGGTGLGICRHQGLLAAAFMEKLATEGILNGRSRYHRNETFLGGHGWARFYSDSGDSYILDAAQNHFGKLIVDEHGRVNANWPYLLKEDYKKLLYRPLF